MALYPQITYKSSITWEIVMWRQEFNERKSVLAKNIKALRLERRVAQERLALESDVDRTLVSKI